MKELKRGVESVVIGCLVALIVFGIIWSGDRVVETFNFWTVSRKDYFDIWYWMMISSFVTYYLYYEEIHKGTSK